MAVVFDGGADWHYWARLALHACTRVWGGRGFILVPHQDGEVGTEMLRAVRAYDPDYVVALERTIGSMEASRPGAIALRRTDGSERTGEERKQFVADHLHVRIGIASDDRARKTVAAACMPHRLLTPVGTDVSELSEHVTSCSASGDIGHLTSAETAIAGLYDTVVGDLPYPRRSCLSSPPDWGGALGVAVASACGVVESPSAGADPSLSARDLDAVVAWLIRDALPSDQPRAAIGEPIQPMVWHPDAALNIRPAQLPTAFDSTTEGLVPIARGHDYPGQTLIRVGDTADDFALAYAHRRLYGAGLWLPTNWLCTDGALDPNSPAFFLLHSLVYWPAVHGRNILLDSSTLPAAELEQLSEKLHDPQVWRGVNGKEEQQEQLKKRIRHEQAAWSTKRVLSFAIDGDFDRDLAVPVTRNDDGDIAMVVSCPPPMITEANLAALAVRQNSNATSALQWQVDAELAPCETPHGRGLAGPALLAEGEPQFAVWVRSGRHGFTVESERYDMIVSGQAPATKLARPRLRAPGLKTWANLMALQQGSTMVLSAAGQRVEIARELWGGRAALAAGFTGPMAAVLHRFRPVKKPEQLKLTPEEGDGLRTGAGDELFEPYLTFTGMTRAAGPALSTNQVREQVDHYLRQGIMRRGLILGCARCPWVAFHAIDHLQQTNACPRCATPNALDQARWRDPFEEPTWYYDLHPTIRTLVVQNGDVPLVLSHHLRTTTRAYTDVAELELYDANGSALAELDLLAHADGQLITAEAKRPADLGKKIVEAMYKRALLADRLQADQIVLATTGEQWEAKHLQAFVNELRQHRWTRVIPRGRLISGLGTPTITDLAIDPETGTISPWPR